MARRAAPAQSKLRARRLRERSEQFQLAQETLGVVTWIWDVRTDRVQWYGDASRLLGLAPGAFSGRFADYLAQVHPQDAEQARSTYIDCVKGLRPEYRSAERIVWPDGTVRWLETYGRADYGPGGRALRLTGVIKDITERKTIESARLKAEQQLARVFDACPDYIAIVRASDARVVAVNRAFERVTGYRAEEVVGRTVPELGLWALPGERERFLADLRGGAGVRNRPVLLRVQGGRIVSGSMSASLIEHEGEELIVGIVHDVTEAKRLERRAHQSERMFGALFESSPEPITLYRLSDGVRLAANSAWERVTGHARDRAQGRPATEMGLFRDPAQRAQLIARVEIEGSVSNAEARLVRADRSAFDALVSAVRIELDGEPCVLWCWRDMSEVKRLEQQVRQSERKFSTLFETSPVALVVTRPSDRRIVEINDAALRLMGLQREDAIGAITTEVVAWPDRAQMEAFRDRGLSRGRVTSAPLRFVRRDGREVEALASAGMVDIEGEPHFVISLLDVTEQRRAEQARRESDARYRALFESTLDSIAILSPDWKFIEINPASQRLSGYSSEELIGQPVSLIFDREELERNPIREDREWTLVERELRRKDGSKLAIEVISGRLPDGNSISITRDISERKRAETLLMNVARGVSAELGEAFFRSLVSHLARELDADFAFIAELVQPGNEHCRTLAFVADGASAPNFEYPLAGSPCASAIETRGTVIYPSGAAAQFPLDTGLAARGIEGYVGTSLHAADGSAIGVLVVMHRKPIQRGPFWGSMIEIFGARAAAEIERSRAEALVRSTNASLEQVVLERTAQLEEANRDLESYNYSISHDLRQPLNAITGFAELLRDAGTPGGQLDEFVREIESNAVRMEKMIDALLQLSRAGRGPLSKAEVDMRGLVEQVLRDLGAAAPLAARVEVGELPPARGDAVLLRQVWMNLIGNALKYSRHSRSPRVRIGGVRRNGQTEFEVSDNGVGFDMKHAERLCETFHRLPSAAAFEGHGIGLAIVQRVVRRHGGSLAASSAPGAGATFRFSLPD